MKTMYVQEVSNAWIVLSDMTSLDRRLIQISKIMGVKENPNNLGSCKVVYYNSSTGKRDVFYPDESFDDIVFDIKGVSSGWLRLTDPETNASELIQASKIVGVQETNQETLSCEVEYYDVIREEKVRVVPKESFEEVSKQLGVTIWDV